MVEGENQIPQGIFRPLHTETDKQTNKCYGKRMNQESPGNRLVVGCSSGILKALVQSHHSSPLPPHQKEKKCWAGNVVQLVSSALPGMHIHGSWFAPRQYIHKY